MSKQELPHASFDPPGKKSGKSSAGRPALAEFIERTHSLNFFYLMAGLIQLLLGISVITVGVLGLIQPLWLSKIFIMLASLSTMIGGYLMYIAKTKQRDSNTLLHDAMQRMMKAKN